MPISVPGSKRTPVRGSARDPRARGFGLRWRSAERGFTLVESSEQGMLAQVARAFQAREPIVFFGWQPHPMNKRYDMRYLTGGDDTFGPDFGGAVIHTVVRKGYLQQCPNVGRFLRNLSFTGAMENDLMDGILNRKLAPEESAAVWLRANPQALAPLLEGVSRAEIGRAHV